LDLILRAFGSFASKYFELFDFNIGFQEKKYHTVGTITKSNIKIVERGKIDTLSHKYTHFPGLVQMLQPKEFLII
jgi:hypothetical protein